MNIGRVLKYLITGVIVGAVLFFAGFGVVNLLKSDSGEIVAVPQPTIEPDATVEAPTVEVTAPAINVAEGTSNSPIKIKPLGSADDSATNADGSTTGEETPTVSFGTLTLNAINSTSKQALKADFLIQNDSGKAIAQVKAVEQTTLSFPVGSYKITVNQGANKIVRYLGVKDGQNGSETFELDIPVAANANNAAAVAVTPTVTPTRPTTSNNAVIIDEHAVAAVRTQSAPPTAKPVAAPTPAAAKPEVETSTKTTTTTVATADTETTETETDSASASTSQATESNSTEVAADGIGGLRVSALTKVGNRPMTASFYIQKLNGENISNVKNVNTHQFNLPAGSYRITARAGTVRMVKQIKVIAARGLHEIFNMPSTPNSVTTTPAVTAPVVAPVVTATAEPTQAAPTPAATADSKATGRLELFSRDATNNKPIRANFYIQTPQGKLITSKTYVESIGYKLPVAPYKVTVRATGYKDKVITLNVRSDQTRRETFKMDLVTPTPVAAPPVSVTVPTPAVAVQPQAAQQGTRDSRRGGLQVSVVSAAGAPLKADIMVLRRNGTPVKRAINASTANFDLNPRNFVVRVRYGGYVTNQQIDVKAGKLAIKTIVFDLNKGFRR